MSKRFSSGGHGGGERHWSDSHAWGRPDTCQRNQPGSNWRRKARVQRGVAGRHSSVTGTRSWISCMAKLKPHRRHIIHGIHSMPADLTAPRVLNTRFCCRQNAPTLGLSWSPALSDDCRGGDTRRTVCVVVPQLWRMLAILSLTGRDTGGRGPGLGGPLTGLARPNKRYNESDLRVCLGGKMGERVRRQAIGSLVEAPLWGWLPVRGSRGEVSDLGGWGDAVVATGVSTRQCPPCPVTNHPGSAQEVGTSSKSMRQRNCLSTSRSMLARLTVLPYIISTVHSPTVPYSTSPRWTAQRDPRSFSWGSSSFMSTLVKTTVVSGSPNLFPLNERKGIVSDEVVMLGKVCEAWSPVLVSTADKARWRLSHRLKDTIGC